MKSLICCVLFLPVLVSVKAQVVVSDISVTPSLITISARLIGKDSVIVPYNDHYEISPDACTKIIRYAHYDFKNRHFYGEFKDVNGKDTTQIIAKGNFTKDGLKDGTYTLNYLNGKLQAYGNFNKDKYDGDWVFYYPSGKLEAKGKFKDGEYVGQWEMYYDNNQPEIFFEGDNGVCKINNEWNSDGVKVINEGTGYYKSDFSNWNGKLVKGLPDSVWKFQMYGGVTPGPSVLEYFKNNKFSRGQSTISQYVTNYTDKSHISLFPPLPKLEINRSEYLEMMVTDCNGKQYVGDFKMFGEIFRTQKNH